ncbi:MAG: iron-sulfur cluster assembly scaffold protein, partial [Candidatus Uhrbacteria bacterium]|nr:iron-sulfur cluster assembly scaffold protein [Candidatus Uhrbacteria bacterium]
RVGKDGVVEAVGFTGAGCVVSMATASMLTERLVGSPADKLSALDLADIEAMLEAPMVATRTRCALLALRAIQRGHEIWKTDLS